MDFSKLSASERMATFASVAVVILAIYALANHWGGLLALPLIAGFGVLAIVFLPQMSPGTSLPGSRGSLLVILGGAAAVFWALGVLSEIGYIFRYLVDVDTIIFLVGFAAALWLGWLGWQAFQAEGGKLVIGSGGAAPASSPPPAPSAPSQASTPVMPPPAATPPPPPAPEPMGQDGGMAGDTNGGSGEETTG